MLLASHQTVMAAVADRAPERRDPTQRYDSRFGTKAKHCVPPCCFLAGSLLLLLGADFLCAHGLVVDVANRQLI